MLTQIEQYTVLTSKSLISEAQHTLEISITKLEFLLISAKLLCVGEER